jgi:hypothetical protein
MLLDLRPDSTPPDAAVLLVVVVLLLPLPILPTGRAGFTFLL